MAIYRVSFKGHFDDGVLTVNSLHYVTQPPLEGSEPAAQDVCQLLKDEWAPLWINANTGAWHFSSVDLTEMVNPLDVNATPRAATVAVTNGGALPATGDKLPEALCGIVSLRTEVARRWARGYVAMPSPRASSYLDASANWTGGYLTALQAIAAKVDDDYEIGTVSVTSVIPVVYSRTQHLRGADQPWAQVSAGVARTKPKWRASRLSAP